MVKEHREIRTIGIFETSVLPDPIYVSQTTGDAPLSAYQHHITANIGRAAQQVVNLRTNRHMADLGGQRAYAEDMVRGQEGDYFFAHNKPGVPSVGTKWTEEREAGPLLGYFRCLYNAKGGVVEVPEMATIGNIDVGESTAILGALMVGALDDPKIMPEALIRLRFIAPSGRGVRAMGNLGLRRDRSPIPSFTGHVHTTMPQLEFLGHNLHRAA
ncbi:MAG TPA: hypothetical protein VLF43_02270 [Candidatus Saccharimonadales bacterium]|nr:hypothetical protein [Candidatus Saccharimonadales bacterium]